MNFLSYSVFNRDNENSDNQFLSSALVSTLENQPGKNFIFHHYNYHKQWPRS